MLDLGFEPAIRAIAGATRTDRQTVMFSATWPDSIQALAAEFLSSAVMVRIGASGCRAAHSITQVVEVIDTNARDERLEQASRRLRGPRKAGLFWSPLFLGSPVFVCCRADLAPAAWAAAAGGVPRQEEQPAAVYHLRAVQERGHPRGRVAAPPRLERAGDPGRHAAAQAQRDGGQLQGTRRFLSSPPALRLCTAAPRPRPVCLRRPRRRARRRC